MIRQTLSVLALTLTGTVLRAAVVGTNTPALPVTSGRIAALSPADRPAWAAYLQRSMEQQRADRRVLQAEMRLQGLTTATSPSSAHGGGGLRLEEPAAWYGQAEARRIADIVVSFQTPSGGWSKNLDLTRRLRQTGEHFAPDNISRLLGKDDLDVPTDPAWNYVGTFDNDATITELKFLGRVIASTGPVGSGSYRAPFLHGLDYVFSAQYPNGGWPQVWPLEGGYHDAITYNDDAMTNILGLLQVVSEGDGDYAFVPADVRARAAASLRHGVACILATQIVSHELRTVWCQQHDPLTLKPESGRNYEMPAKTAPESASLVEFLMELPRPSPEIVAAVHAAAAWLKKTALYDVAFRASGPGGRRLLPAPGSGPIWARFYDLATDRPIFGDRDKSLHDDVNELSRERRDGYSWYSPSPDRALREYAKWSQAHPVPGP